MILEQYPNRQTFTDLAGSATVIPVATRILADTDTPVSILQKCYDADRECFLLESVEGGERWARYSFFGVSAFGHIKVFQDQVTLSTRQTEKAFDHNGDPLGVMRDILGQFVPADIPDLPRFWSGVTGYFSYEVVSFFEDIQVSLPEGTPYGHFIIPEQMVIFDNVDQTMTCLNICYLSPGADPGDAYEEGMARLNELVGIVQKPFTGPVARTSAPAELKALTPPEEYMDGVKKIKAHIIEGDIFQAVYSQPFACETDVDPVLIYRAQRYINPSPYMFFMNFKDRVVAGSSPETMVRLENGVATLRPIAGTRPRGQRAGGPAAGRRPAQRRKGAG